jgi:hypothetical protein
MKQRFKELRMATLTRDCPHCKDRNSSFTIQWSAKWIKGDNFDQVAVATCGGCGKPICFQTRIAAQIALTAIQGNIDSVSGMIVGPTWPAKEQADIPRHLPPEYAAKIKEAEGAFLAKLPTAAAGLFRALVDTTTKRQLAEAELDTKGTLMARIERLAENHIIPKTVADWAHEVRTIGNEGLHEEMVITADDASMTRNFAQTYLRYAFELPGDVAARKGFLI